jgi:hypothetical protein
MALVATAWWLSGRPGGRVGAIALAATGVAAAYIDVIAVTTIYHWVPAPLGLVIAAVVGGGGLTLARRWDSQHLGLLVLVPLIVLAPVVTDGITLLLVGFMLALTAASLPVQLGRTGSGCTRRLAAARSRCSLRWPGASTTAAICGSRARGTRCAGVAGALIPLPRMVYRAAMAPLTAAGGARAVWSRWPSTGRGARCGGTGRGMLAIAPPACRGDGRCARSGLRCRRSRC